MWNDRDLDVSFGWLVGGPDMSLFPGGPAPNGSCVCAVPATERETSNKIEFGTVIIKKPPFLPSRRDGLCTLLLAVSNRRVKSSSLSLSRDIPIVGGVTRRVEGEGSQKLELPVSFKWPDLRREFLTHTPVRGPLKKGGVKGLSLP